MTSNIPAKSRNGMPIPFDRCEYDGCNSGTPVKKDCSSSGFQKPASVAERDPEFLNRFRLNCHLRDCKLHVDEEIATSSASMTSRKRNPNRVSIFDIPEENLEQIFAYAADISSSICLAFSGKKLFRIFSIDKIKKLENKRWNSQDGPWKQQLFPLLAEGWIPKDRLRACWRCWRFLKYGKASEDYWRSIIRLRCCPHGALKCGANWETKIWLEADGKGQGSLSIFDQRVRCPLCVLDCRPIRLMMPNSEITRRRKKNDGCEAQEKILEQSAGRPRNHRVVSRWDVTVKEKLLWGDRSSSGSN